MPSECTIQCPCFQNCLCSSKSFKIPSEWTLFGLSPKKVLYSSKCRQNVPSTVPVFKIVSAVPNRIKYRQNEPFTFFVPQNVLCCAKLFQIPSERTIYCPCIHSLQEAILVLMLHPLFWYKLWIIVSYWSSKYVQIVTECML